MRKIYVAVILTFLFMTVFSCSSDITETTTPGSIAGSVADNTTGELVATVNIGITPGGSSTVTGSDGRFVFNNLDDGEYTLTITKEGYKPNSSTVLVRTGVLTHTHLLIERIPTSVTADRELLDFGSNASTNTLSFNIVNPGYVALEWEIENRCAWITEVKPAKGKLEYGKTEGIVVVIDRAKLPEGSNEAVIVVRSSNGSAEVKVTASNVMRLPIVSIDTPVGQTKTSAWFYGKIDDAGHPAYSERGFVYSENRNPTMETGTQVIAQYSTADEYSCLVSDLVYGQMYYIKAYAINNNGTTYSNNEAMFRSLEVLPTVVTVGVDTQTDSAATLRGNVTNIGDPAYTERGFVYGTIPEPTIYDNKIVANGEAVAGAYSIYATGLPSTTYYVRSYATTPAGTAYGNEIKIEISADWIELPAAKLAVQRKDIGQGYWGNINSMCQNSILGGCTDWRLPNKDELMTIYLNREYIGGFTQDKYWSSSSAGYVGRYYFYYYIHFSNGYSSDNTSDTSNYGRCVRTLK